MMNNNNCFVYEAPATEIIYVEPCNTFLTSAIEGSSSESFEGSDDNFDSIW